MKFETGSARLQFDVQAIFMGIDVNVRNTEKSEIRILVYIHILSSHDDICVYTVDTKMGFHITSFYNATIMNVTGSTACTHLRNKGALML